MTLKEFRELTKDCPETLPLTVAIDDPACGESFVELDRAEIVGEDAVLRPRVRLASMRALTQGQARKRKADGRPHMRIVGDDPPRRPRSPRPEVSGNLTMDLRVPPRIGALMRMMKLIA